MSRWEILPRAIFTAPKTVPGSRVGGDGLRGNRFPGLAGRQDRPPCQPRASRTVNRGPFQDIHGLIAFLRQQGYPQTKSS